MPTRKNEAAWIESRQRWQIKVQREGVRKTFTSNTPGKKGKIAAERAADFWMEEGLESDLRMDRAWALFLADKKQNSSTSDHAKHEQMGRLWILPKLKAFRLSRLTRQHWKDCINAGYKHGLSRKSLQNIRASISSFAAFADDNRWPLESPGKIKIPKDAPVGERKILQPDQLRTLFAVAHMTDHGKLKEVFYIHAWRFQVLTGLRPGEVAGIQKRQDVKDQLLQVQRSVNVYGEVTGGKNDNARRNMLLTRQAMAVLDDQAAMLKRMGIISKWAFPGPDGGQMVQARSYDQWAWYRKKNGISCSLYELRHTMVSLSQDDMPKQLLKRLVGHSETMDTYGVYGHSVDGELDRAKITLEGVFEKLI